MCKENHTPVATDQPTIFESIHGASGTFDVGPFLDAFSMFGSDEMIQNLDSIICDLCAYYLEYDAAHDSSNDMLRTARLLRNAILKGGGFLDFEL